MKVEALKSTRKRNAKLRAKVVQHPGGYISADWTASGVAMMRAPSSYAGKITWVKSAHPSPPLREHRDARGLSWRPVNA